MSGPGGAPEATRGRDAAIALAGSSASTTSPAISLPPIAAGMQPDPVIVRADERRASLATVTRADRARDHHPLRARAQPAGGLRRAVALVGRESGHLLGHDLGLLRRRGQLRARTRPARDARRRVVP